MIGPRPAGRPGSRKRQLGFTLIEIVVAFVLLALVLGVSYEIFSTGLKRAGDLEDYSRALSIAQSRLAEASFGEQFQEGQAQGQSEDRRFTWTTTISAFATESEATTGQFSPPPYQPVRVAVRVTWRNGAEDEKHLDLATLVVGKAT